MNTENTNQPEKTETTTENLIVGKNRNQKTFIIKNKKGLEELMRNYLGFGKDFKFSTYRGYGDLTATYQNKNTSSWRESIENVYISRKDTLRKSKEEIEAAKLEKAQYIRLEEGGYGAKTWSRLTLGQKYTLSQLDGMEGKIGKFLWGYESKVKKEEEASLIQTFEDSATEIFSKIIKDKLNIITHQDITDKLNEELLKTDFEDLVKQTEKLENKWRELDSDIDYGEMQSFLNAEGSLYDQTEKYKLEYPPYKKADDAKRKYLAKEEETKDLVSKIQKGVYGKEKGIGDTEYIADFSKGFDVQIQSPDSAGKVALTGYFSVDVYDLVYGNKFLGNHGIRESHDENLNKYTRFGESGLMKDNLVMTLSFNFEIVKFEKNAHIENLSLQIIQPVKTERYSDNKEVLTFGLEELLTSDNSKFETLLEEVYALRKQRNNVSQLERVWKDEFSVGHYSPHNLTGKVMMTAKQS